MDKKTREYRRQMKANRTKRGELSPFESRGLGVKGKPAKTFPQRRCEFVHGGKKVYAKKKIETPQGTKWANFQVTVGGTRCAREAIIGNRCLVHHRSTPTD